MKKVLTEKTKALMGISGKSINDPASVFWEGRMAYVVIDNARLMDALDFLKFGDKIDGANCIVIKNP